MEISVCISTDNYFTLIVAAGSILEMKWHGSIIIIIMAAKATAQRKNAATSQSLQRHSIYIPTKGLFHLNFVKPFAIHTRNITLRDKGIGVNVVNNTEEVH